MWNFSLASQEFSKIGFVYKWTNTVNGMMYLGSHNGSDHKYIGSGTLFREAVLEYGIENFYRELLYVGPRFFEVEKEILISIDARQSSNFYNQINTWSQGTLGKSPNLGVPLSEAHRKAISEGTKRLVPTGTSHFNYGLKRSEETKQKLRDTHTKPRKGNHIRWHQNRNIIQEGCEFC